MGNKISQEYKLVNFSPQLRVCKVALGWNDVEPVLLHFPPSKTEHEGDLSAQLALDKMPQAGDLIQLKFWVQVSAPVQGVHVVVALDKRAHVKQVVRELVAAAGAGAPPESFAGAAVGLTLARALEPREAPYEVLLAYPRPSLIRFMSGGPEVLDVRAWLDGEACAQASWELPELPSAKELLRKRRVDLDLTHHDMVAMKWYTIVVDSAGFEHSRFRLKGAARVTARDIVGGGGARGDGGGGGAAARRAKQVSTREIKYTMNGISMVGSTGVTEKHTLCWAKDKKSFTVKTVTKTPKVPYGTSFETQMLFCAHAISDSSCQVTATGACVFFKNIMLKGKIRSGAEDGLRKFMTAFNAALAGAGVKVKSEAVPASASCACGKGAGGTHTHLDVGLSSNVYDISLDKLFDLHFSSAPECSGTLFAAIKCTELSVGTWSASGPDESAAAANGAAAARSAAATGADGSDSPVMRVLKVAMLPFSLVGGVLDRLPFDWMWWLAVALAIALVVTAALLLRTLQRVELLALQVHAESMVQRSDAAAAAATAAAAAAAAAFVAT